MQMNPERNICRRSSQKQRGETRAPMGGGAGGSGIGLRSALPPVSHPRSGDLATPGALSHSLTFHFLLWGQGLSQPLHPGLGVGRVCVRSARLQGGDVGEGREGLSLPMIFPGVIPPCSLYLMSSVIHKGRRREICQFPFEK